MQNFKPLFRILLLSFILTLVNCTKVSTSDYYVDSVREPIINLNGDWKISLNPPKEFWKDTILTDTWEDIQVPGEVMMQGFSIKNDMPFAYKKEIDIPSDYKGKNIFLQFDGVYSYARVWVNGNYVRDHHGGFTRWKCDITPFVKPGEKAWITVEVTDRADDISYASGYAKHQIGGILRDVNLMALPEIYPEEIKIETDLNDKYINADLIISGELNNELENSKIELKLFDENQKEIKLKNPIFTFDKESHFKITNLVDTPAKWDAEHPNLYSLQVLFYNTDNDVQWSKKYKFGFREVKVDANIFLVNGKPVKLRGACRHDVHPLLGRVSTPEYDLKDVLLAKEANMNYIRTSHYPPTDNFLSLCDEYGIYVEDETAVCFVNEYRMKGYAYSNLQNDPAFTDRFLSQLEEMVDNHRNHPSVIIWSIGNENSYGLNFQKSFDWVKETDKTRPIMFSYPGAAPDSIAPYNILSMHYPDINGDLNQWGKITKGFSYGTMPAIFDEWAHVACYNNQTIKEDPNIRDFWGQSLDKMWAKTFDADGGLGGAIWGMIDETFMLPKNLDGFGDWWGIDENSVLPYQGKTIGYGEWGIIDVWRRKKPEFWNTKKAYSPIRILTTTIEDYKNGSKIQIPVYNRFDHTNLNEVTIKFTYKDHTASLNPVDLDPHNKGILDLPIKQWDSDKEIAIAFYDNSDNLIDSYTIKQQDNSKIKSETKEASVGKITMTNNERTLVVHTNKGGFYFDKGTGLLTKIMNGTKVLNVSGPHMTYRTKGDKLTYSTNHINAYGKGWNLNKFDHKLKKNVAVISLKGTYNMIKASFDIKIDAEGNITTSYSYKKLPKEYVRELGVKYIFDDTFDTLSWERNAYWSAYPKDHLSAASGEVPLYANIINRYRKAPEKPWILDTKSFYYKGTDDENKDELTYVASASKEHIIDYSLLKNNKKLLIVKGNGDVSCRLAKKENSIELYLNNELDYVDLSWGNYQRNIILEGTYTGEIEFKMNPLNN